jgi:cytochrome b pre-mRNA-processing protein 3
MLGFLFRRLTAGPERGAELFDRATREAREPHWYSEGEVPDTIDGRFAVLATILALVIVRLEREQSGGADASVALTERFIAVMESEHRELGLGDPALGKTVRKLVGALARRTALWRSAVIGERDWAEAARESLYKGSAAPEALRHCSEALERLWAKLARTSIEELEAGKFQ